MQTVKKVIKKVAKLVMALPFIIKFVAIFALISMLVTVFDWLIEIFTADNTPDYIYSTFGVKDMRDLVEIKKSEDDSGYYLDFVDDFDEKVGQIFLGANNIKGLHVLLTDEEFIKKIIKAEVVTQFPNLGGNIPEDSNGFQGAIDIRRVTPNKQIGSIDDNPGRGETTTLEPEVVYDTVDEKILNEGKVKKWEKGQKLEITSEAIVYAQRESELNPGSDTGSWYAVKQEENPDKDVTIPAGTVVTYTGTYKTSVNALNSTLSEVYVEVKSDELTGYVSGSVLIKKQEEQTAKKKQEVTARAKKNNKNQGDTVGKAGEEYTIAIAAGHNSTDNTGAQNGDLKEEELTIKTAEKVEELLSKYTNIKVVQVGSTSDNPGGVKKGERTKLARKANPDLCIQIHYNAGGGTGVEAIYKDGDGVSQQLAEFLSESMATSMELPNRGAGPDLEKCAVGSLGIIESAASSGFPSVVTEGGFIDKEPDASLLRGEGTDKCAEGIVEGIIKYLEADHTGYTATNVGSESSQESINSKVYNLKYVEPETLEDLLTKANEGDSNAEKEILKVYTLDEENKLVTTAWEAEDGVSTYKKNSSVDFKTSLQKYIMPYEYLLYYYIDTNEGDFSEKLAEEVINTEIVIVVQDNVTTVKTTENTVQWTEATDSTYSSGEQTVSAVTTTTETCTPKIEITYADTWCVKFYKENSYSSEALGWKEKDSEKVLDIKGKVTKTSSESDTGTQTIDTGSNVVNADNDGKNGTYINWWTYQKTRTSSDNMTIQYDSGESTIQGNENKFITLYQNSNMQNWIREAYLFRIIENNEKTANLLDLTKYLMYKATSIYYGVVEFDFSEYDLEIFQNVSNGNGNATDISLTTSVMDKETFVKALQAYYDKTGNADFKQNFLSRAEEIYDLGLKYNINPELIVTMALKESGFKSSGGNQNYWGWGTPNGSSLAYIATFEEGVKKLATTFGDYQVGGSMAGMITQRNDEREANNCNTNGYGLPGTLKGMLSVYSDLCGSDTKHREGNWGSGGNIYLRIIYGSEFEAKCGSVHKIGIDDYTIQERADYTAYLYEQQLKFWNNIFGEFASLGGGTASKEGWSTTGLSCPRYYQNDGKWASNPYNYGPGKTIGTGGCGACALAMGVSGLLEEDITPDVIVNYLNSINMNTVYNGAGSAEAIAKKYGLTYQLIDRNNKSAINHALDAGKVCIFSIDANGIYTGGGHFIMCNGRSGDQYYVLESGHYYETDKGYTYNQVFSPGVQGVFVLGRPANFQSKSKGNTDIVNIAKTKLGCSYVYGAAGPNTFDCSGFVQWVYGKAGISLPRTTYDYTSYKGTGKEVSWKNVQAGDIVWRTEHMGIYIGNDQYIHAPRTGDVIKISSGASSGFTNVFRFSK